LSRLGKEQKTLEAMVGLYCSAKHGPLDGTVCEACRELLDYAAQRLEKCPFGEEKPKCSQCTVHCYKPDMRERVREVMRFAGPRMLTKHPVMAVQHLVQGLGHKSRGAGD
jgi:hypothetical protein